MIFLIEYRWLCAVCFRKLSHAEARTREFSQELGHIFTLQFDRIFTSSQSR